MPGKPYTATEKAAMRRDKAIGNTGIGRLTRALQAKPKNKAGVIAGTKNANGIQTATPEELRLIKARMKAKYQR
jgi:hypothetical protein